MSGQHADLHESMIVRPNYYGCPRVLTWINLAFMVLGGLWFQLPGTWVPALVLTVPCAIVIHLWAAWLTLGNRFIFVILWRRFQYLRYGSKIGRFHV